MPVLNQYRAIEDSSMWEIKWVFRQHWTDVQTDVHIVPVDSDAQSRNLLKMPTASGALVLVWGSELLSASTIPPLHHVLTHWFVGISYVCRWWLMHRVMYTNASQYVSNRDGVFYYIRRIPHDVRQHYASSRISFSLRTKSLRSAARTASSVPQRLEDYWLGLRLQQMDIPAIHLSLIHISEPTRPY